MAATLTQHHNLVPVGQEPISSLPSIDRSSSPHEIPLSSRPAEHIPRGPVSATLNFYKAPADGSKPHNWVEKPPEGEPQRNFGDVDKTVEIHDIRGREDDFSMDKQAFEVAHNKPHNEAIDWTDDESIKTHYYPEVERLLLEYAPGAERVLIFDHTIRRADPKAHRAPVNRAHIDQTSKSAKQRVEFHLPDEAEKLLQGRYRIINVWRPLNGKVQSYPLAFAASPSVLDEDMVPVEHRYPTRTGETAAIQYNPNHQWHYLSGVDNDERIFLQCYDSSRPNNRVPHSAFVDPRTTDQMKPRESIEVRALVFG